MKILINKTKNATSHSTSWNNPWIAYAEEHGIPYETADLLACNAIEKLRGTDCLLWQFGQYRYAQMLETRSILYSAKLMGIKVFPDYPEAWHFDDKIAEMYALQAVGAPIPKSWIFYDMDSLKQNLEKGDFTFPIVAKLRTGSGSHNVKLIRNRTELLKYAKTMFFKGGFDSSPSLAFKTISNVRSSHDFKTFMAKVKRAPEFLRTRRGAKEFPNEKGYVYLQEFIPNDGFDMKVVVVGDKVSGLHRPIRTNDFRASGGGETLHDKSLFTKELIEMVFKTTDALDLQCIGYDVVIDNRNGKPVIIEMSYGFAHEAVMKLGGYFDRSGIWHDEPLNAPAELLHNMLNQ